MHTAEVTIKPEQAAKIKKLKEKHDAQDQKELFVISDATDEEEKISKSKGKRKMEPSGFASSTEDSHVAPEKDCDSLNIQSESVDLLPTNTEKGSEGTATLGTENENKTLQEVILTKPVAELGLPLENSDVDGLLGTENSVPGIGNGGRQSSDERDSKLRSSFTENASELRIKSTDMDNENESGVGELDYVPSGVIF